MNQRRLKKSQNDRWFLGVIGGIGEYFGLSADAITLVRIVVLVLSFGSMGTLFFVYIVLALIMPDSQGRTRYERRRDYYDRQQDYHDRWQEKSEKMRQKYEKKADDYEANWDNYSQSKSKKKIKEAEKITDDDNWSDF